MSAEEVIIGILDESQASGSVKAEELRSLLCDYLQLSPYHPVLLEVLDQAGLSFEENAKIDIQAIFKAVGTAHFTKNIPSYYNNRITKYSIKLLKAAITIYSRGLLTMAELRDGASAHQMKEFETLSIGVPCTVQNMHSILWVLRKTINNALLVKWMQAHAKFFDTPGMIMVHEFLYLLCNSVYKEEMLQKIPKIPMNVKMDKKIKLFQIDKDFAKTCESPDNKIQHLMLLGSNVDQAVIEGICSPPAGNQKPNLKNQKKQSVRIDQFQEDGTDSFRKKLRSMVMTVGIKTKLKEYHQKLIRSRLNGKAAFDKLVFHGDEGLPNPMDLATQMKIESGTFPNKKKKDMFSGRPMTAQHRPQSASMSFKPGNMPYKPRPSPLSPSSFSKLFVSPDDVIKNSSLLKESKMKSFKSVDSHPKHQQQHSQPTLEQLSSPLKSWNQRNLAQTASTFQFKPTSHIDEFEQMLSEEFQAFEFQNQAGTFDRRSKSITYFNSAFLSPNATRIQSSKPGSPGVPTSPLNKRILSGSKVGQ